MEFPDFSDVVADDLDRAVGQIATLEERERKAALRVWPASHL